jgi:hypothetical protein
MIGPFDSVCVREWEREWEIVCVCEVGSLALHILLSDICPYMISASCPIQWYPAFMPATHGRLGGEFTSRPPLVWLYVRLTLWESLSLIESLSVLINISQQLLTESRSAYNCLKVCPWPSNTRATETMMFARLKNDCLLLWRCRLGCAVVTPPHPL